MQQAARRSFRHFCANEWGLSRRTVHADEVLLNFLSGLPAAEAVLLQPQRLEAVQARLDELRTQGVEDAGERYGVDYLLHRSFSPSADTFYRGECPDASENAVDEWLSRVEQQ